MIISYRFCSGRNLLKGEMFSQLSNLLREPKHINEASSLLFGVF